eukprot:488159_1
MKTVSYFPDSLDQYLKEDSYADLKHRDDLETDFPLKKEEIYTDFSSTLPPKIHRQASLRKPRVRVPFGLPSQKKSEISKSLGKYANSTPTSTPINMFYDSEKSDTRPHQNQSRSIRQDSYNPKPEHKTGNPLRQNQIRNSQPRSNHRRYSQKSKEPSPSVQLTVETIPIRMLTSMPIPEWCHVLHLTLTKIR